MQWIEDFTAFIQLVSAINFMYVFTQFSEKVYKTVFDEGRMYHRLFTSHIESMAALKSSLEEMSLDGLSDRVRIERKREGLIENFSSLDEQWKESQKQTKDEVSKSLARKGIKSLFLYASIYCVICLFFMAIVKATGHQFPLIMLYVLNIECFAFMIILSYNAFKDRWNQYSEASCYEQTTKVFLFLFVFSFCVSVVNTICTDLLGICYPIPNYVSISATSLCIINTVYPIIFTFIYVVYKIRQIEKHAENNTKSLITQLEELDKKKKKIDTAFEVLSAEISW